MISEMVLLIVRRAQDGGPKGLILALKSRIVREPDLFLESR